MLFLVSVLALWRVCHFLAHESGPFNVMEDYRYFIADVLPEGYEWITCVACSSVWLCFPPAYFLFNEHFLIYWLGLSAGVVLLEAAHAVLWKKG